MAPHLLCTINSNHMHPSAPSHAEGANVAWGHRAGGVPGQGYARESRESVRRCADPARPRAGRGEGCAAVRRPAAPSSAAGATRTNFQAGESDGRAGAHLCVFALRPARARHGVETTLATICRGKHRQLHQSSGVRRWAPLAAPRTPARMWQLPQRLFRHIQRPTAHKLRQGGRTARGVTSRRRAEAGLDEPRRGVRAEVCHASAKILASPGFGAICLKMFSQPQNGSMPGIGAVSQFPRKFKEGWVLVLPPPTTGLAAPARASAQRSSGENGLCGPG